MFSWLDVSKQSTRAHFPVTQQRDQRRWIAQDLFGAVGDPTPATLYEVAGWLLAPAPEERAPAAEEVEDDEQPEDQDAL